MRKAISTVSLSGTLPEKLYAISKAGFDAVEIFSDDLVQFTGKIRDIRLLTEDLNLKIVLLQPLRDFDGIQPENRNKATEHAKKMFEQMNNLGCQQLLACSTTDIYASPYMDIQIENLLNLAEIARQHDCYVAYEALSWGRYVNRLSQAWDRVRIVDHPNLGLILDSFHVLAIQDSLDIIKYIPVEKLFFIQIADADPPPTSICSFDEWSRHYRCFPGRGILAIEAFAKSAQQTGYKGIWSLEIFSDRYKRISPHSVAREGLNSLISLENFLIQQHGTT
ncbi:sugar phosphate isomerase/epimerase family protein [Candidatus Schneideria nysicola]|uniref:sugar phosphate isomerase/epimerase family protein n=1 Tax=Candidatus Schneideria nysicola TaxID=1081631 RepID=UPI001CAA58C0|nr:sugar phosphate isomerase/epimerase [Candidatus Schneideria nysicola]UAJ66289.1 sugar phosphate isomerase/epimerase [Candidatus Schneideria nysicola]